MTWREYRTQAVLGGVSTQSPSKFVRKRISYRNGSQHLRLRTIVETGPIASTQMSMATVVNDDAFRHFLESERIKPVQRNLFTGEAESVSVEVPDSMPEDE